MRLNINARSTDELMKIMSHYGISNPTHMIQTMISQLNNSIPAVEDKDEYKQSNQTNRVKV